MMPNQMMEMLGQLKANPIQFLMRRRLQLPQNIPTDNSQAILNYLLQSGQISQQQVNSAYQMAQKFM